MSVVVSGAAPVAPKAPVHGNDDAERCNKCIIKSLPHLLAHPGNFLRLPKRNKVARMGKSLKQNTLRHWQFRIHSPLPTT
jgi:hypothetical protein